MALINEIKLLERRIAVGLIVITFPLMATEHLFHYSIALLGLMGVWNFSRLWIRGGRFPVPASDTNWVWLAFGCVFIPMLLSLPDAFQPQRATKTVFSYLHFLPAALYINVVCRDPSARSLILRVVALLLGLLVVDALVQFTFGTNLLGFDRHSAVLTGMFDSNQRLGLVLALFLPLALYFLQTQLSWGSWKWSFLIPYGVVILFSLKRSAWVMLVIGALAYFFVFLVQRGISWRTKVLIPTLAVGVVLVTGYLVPTVGVTLKSTFGALNADYETLDIATSRRLTLWRTGTNIMKAHPVNGIGPRGYRYAYRSFAEDDDFWIAQGSKGQTHPHLMGLEILVETGLVGLLGLVVLVTLLARRIFAKRITDPDGAMWLILVAVAWFPLNTHLAFYGSYWSSFAWLFLGIGASNIQYAVSQSKATVV